MKIFKLFLLTAALIFSLAACGGTDEPTTAKQDQTTSTTPASDVEAFTITAKNWKFSSDKELVIKKGTKVKINLVNSEGVHSIHNDDLGIDITTDKPAEFTAEKVGEYELKCSTICGAIKDHESMGIKLKIID